MGVVLWVTIKLQKNKIGDQQRITSICWFSFVNLPITCSALIQLADYLFIYKNKMCVHSDNEEGHLKISAKYSVPLNLTQIIYHRQKDYSLFFYTWVSVFIDGFRKENIYC